MGVKRVYADATTLIGQARIGRLDLLSLLPTLILITDHVWAEVASEPGRPGGECAKRGPSHEVYCRSSRR